MRKTETIGQEGNNQCTDQIKSTTSLCRKHNMKSSFLCGLKTLIAYRYAGKCWPYTCDCYHNYNDKRARGESLSKLHQLRETINSSIYHCAAITVLPVTHKQRHFRCLLSTSHVFYS